MNNENVSIIKMYGEILTDKEYITNPAIARDEEINKQLQFMGWTVLRFWGKDIKKNLDACVKTIEDTIMQKKISDTNWIDDSV